MGYVKKGQRMKKRVMRPMDLYPAQTHALLDKEPRVGIFRNIDLDASL